MELQRKAWLESETLEPLDLFRLALFRVWKARNLLCSGGILACFALGEPWNSHLLFLRRHLSSATWLLKAFCSESAFPSTVLGQGQGQGVNRCFILSTRVQPVQRLPLWSLWSEGGGWCLCDYREPVCGFWEKRQT